VGAVEIREWKVPYEQSRPRDPFVDREGRVWFVGQRTHYIAYLNPETGEFKKFDLEGAPGPHNLVVDGYGIVWYAGNLEAHIGRLDPRTGEIRKCAMPDPAARDPHTLVFGKPGEIWFTAQGGNMIGRLEIATGRIRLVAVPTPRARPYGIKVDAKGRPWIVLFGTNKLATVDPETMTLEEIELPRADARPRRLEIDSRGDIWYVDHDKGRVGRYEVASRRFEEWMTPGGESARPYGTAMDGADRLWFVESGVSPNSFVGFDTREKRFLPATPIASGGGSVRHMYFHKPADEVWFGTDTNTIGRAKLPAPSR
jgi:virginiamycin B lyase